MLLPSLVVSPLLNDDFPAYPVSMPHLVQALKVSDLAMCRGRKVHCVQHQPIIVPYYVLHIRSRLGPSASLAWIEWAHCNSTTLCLGWKPVLTCTTGTLACKRQSTESSTQWVTQYARSRISMTRGNVGGAFLSSTLFCVPRALASSSPAAGFLLLSMATGVHDTSFTEKSVDAAHRPWSKDIFKQELHGRAFQAYDTAVQTAQMQSCQVCTEAYPA